MATPELFVIRKNHAEEALRSAKILFPSSSATSPTDNSVPALLARLRLSQEAAISDYVDEKRDEVSPGNGVESLDKQELLRQGAKRGLEILETVQEWLILEEQKSELGLTATDCELSTIPS